MRFRYVPLVAAGALALPLALAAGPAQAATAARPYDFNGDGKADLVVGAPDLNRAAIAAAGGVVVFPSGDSAAPGRAKIITQSTTDVAGGSEANDYFGSAVASADFDLDGYADLAVGLPGEDFTGKVDAGAVTILYGTSSGLTGKRSVQISEPSGKYQFAGFGGALATGDLNRDGYPDLVVGAEDDQRDPTPAEDYPASGSVTTLYGGKSGITTTGSKRLLGDRTGDDHDYRFGAALAVSDVDADGKADVVVISRGAQSGDANGYAGSVSYCPAGGSGLPSSCRRLVQDRALGTANAVVAGNVVGGLRPEIVVGVPFRDIDGDPGSLQVLTLSGAGAGTTASVQRVDQTDAGLPGAAEETGDDFGYALALGDVDRDGYADVVVGAPGEVSDEEEAGRVFVVRGGSSGLATSGNLAFDQNTPGVPGGSEDGDGFGAAVTLLDRNGDGRLDLTVGAPGEDDGTGRVTTLLGAGSGFTTEGSRAFGLREVDPNYDNRVDASFGAALGR